MIICPLCLAKSVLYHLSGTATPSFELANEARSDATQLNSAAGSQGDQRAQSGPRKVHGAVKTVCIVL